jgi:hypothetical protein
VDYLTVDEHLEFMKQIALRLESADIPYMVTGSMAMTLYAMPRMTRDIDFVVEYGSEDADRIVRLFQPDCYVDAESVRRAATERDMFNIIHNEWIIKADFIVRKDSAYHQLEFTRRRCVDIKGAAIAVVAPEDLILSKLEWAKDSQSELQKRDTRQIVESMGDLDWAYLENWAVSLGIGDLLEQVRSK